MVLPQQPRHSHDQDLDWVWIKQFQEGERAAFDEIFNKYKGILINLSFRFVRDRGAAEEIAQEVFMKIYEKKVKVDPGSKFFTWLYRVTVNASLDFLRKKKFVSQSLDEEQLDQEGERRKILDKLADPRDADPSRVLEQNETALFVQNQIAQLPEHLKTCILLAYFQDLSYREIAQILHVTEKAVERRIYHGKQLLKKKLAACL